MDQFFMKMFVALQTGLHGMQQTRKDNERGATAVEYGLLVALIAAVIVGVVATLGTKVADAFQTIADALP